MQNNQLELSHAFCVNGHLCNDTQGADPCAFELGPLLFFPPEYLTVAIIEKDLKVSCWWVSGLLAFWLVGLLCKLMQLHKELLRLISICSASESQQGAMTSLASLHFYLFVVSCAIFPPLDLPNRPLPSLQELLCLNSHFYLFIFFLVGCLKSYFKETLFKVFIEEC